MYYITNKTKQIIAVDTELLQQLHVKSIEELNQKILLNKIDFTAPLQEKMTIFTSTDTLHFTLQTSQLSSILGELYLIILQLENTKETLIPKDEHVDNVVSDLIIPQAPKKSINTITLKESNPHIETIFVPVEKLSEEIGISQEDYKTFLNEYIDTALSLESNLRSSDTSKYDAAIKTLKQLTEALQLPKIDSIITKLATPFFENNRVIDTFYTTLSKLTTNTSTIQSNYTESKDEITSTINNKESIVTASNTIELNKVEPIHFYFSVEKAADNLGLPIILIEEFINDFIQQTHIETEKMIAAYKQNDITTIKKIAHLLKDASSNLRIHTLSDTLYNIQHCEDYSKLNELIKHYWGHFLSFTQQIDDIKKSNRK